VVEFGLFVNPAAANYENASSQVEAAERGGLDLIGIQDHPYQRRFLDTWALIGDLLARTERLRFFPDVANLPLRLPTMMAKHAASLDVLSGGRFELGLGAGAFWDAIAAMGGPSRSAKESVDALEEAIQILRACWSAERSVDFSGEHYSVKGFHPGPPPAHPIGIWLGAYQPRMLRMTGRLADGWLPSLGHLPPDRLAEAQQRISDAAARAGRDPSHVRRLYNVNGTITDGERGEGPLDGPVDQWVDTLSGWVRDLGVEAFVIALADAAQVERLAGEVVPGVRAAV
jgi:alkanesulfonate monooxygenase SsuD/methylene tetrahydromethanopterin reductase-like flavin-dependent oxidoreductase (luciferase family)